MPFRLGRAEACVGGLGGWVAALIRFASPYAGFEPSVPQLVPEPPPLRIYSFSAIVAISDPFHQPGAQGIIHVDRFSMKSFEVANGATKRSAYDRRGILEHFREKVDPGTWLKPGAWGCKRKARLCKAPRPPTQASARPSLKGTLTEKRGRDVGFAESVFRPTVMGRKCLPEIALKGR
jgi:hypothetical protein